MKKITKKKAVKKTTPRKKPAIPKNKMLVDISHIEEIYDEVCDEWKVRLEDDFPNLFNRYGEIGVGDRFINGGEEYILAEVDENNGVALISLEHGGMWTVAYSVHDTGNIDRKEFSEITVDEIQSFKKIK